jgi:hypothetical protein
MQIIPTSTVHLLLSLVSLTTAIHFSGYREPACRGLCVASSSSLEPNECYTIVKSDLEDPLLSIEATGLQSTNALGRDSIELFESGDCRNWKSRVRWNEICMGVRYRSVMYIPPSEKNASMVSKQCGT